ncbi:Ead/Ea22-like protein [Pantoea sesami]|nr:Ead/Ea22-like protein [Pantoea sesami]
MSNIDKRALREAAEKATPGPWGIASNGKTITSNQSHPVAVITEDFHRLLANGKTGGDAEFIAAANPATVLALLDELEAKDQRIAELEVLAFSPAILDVISERQRQRSVEGWTSEHDDAYQNNELADAAACYAIHAHNQGLSTPAHWPWDPEWWKQSGPRRDLVKAGALILAEIERIDRAAKGER